MRERGPHVGHLHPIDVRRGRDRLGDHRPDSLDQLDVDPHAQHRRDDVGEEHGRVNAVPPHRLESHLGAELRRVRNLEERVAFAQSAILGERPAGLAHEPHRGPLDLLAPQRADQERVGHGRTLARVDRRPPARRPRRTAGRPLARLRARSPAGRRDRNGDGRARERRRRSVARRAARLPLARRARQRDRLGRPPHAARAPRAGRARRGRGPRPGAHASRPLPARIRPRDRGPLLALGDRQRAARRRRRRPPARRGRSGPAPPSERRAGSGLARARPGRARGGVRRGRRRDREPRARAAPLPGGRRPQPVLRRATRLPVAAAAARAELRGRGPAGWRRRATSRGSTTAASERD